MLLGILRNLWSLQDGRVEVNPDPAAPARYLLMVNSGGRTDSEENQERRERQTH